MPSVLLETVPRDLHLWVITTLYYEVWQRQIGVPGCILSQGAWRSLSQEGTAFIREATPEEVAIEEGLTELWSFQANHNHETHACAPEYKGALTSFSGLTRDGSLVLQYNVHPQKMLAYIRDLYLSQLGLYEHGTPTMVTPAASGTIWERNGQFVRNATGQEARIFRALSLLSLQIAEWSPEVGSFNSAQTWDTVLYKIRQRFEVFGAAFLQQGIKVDADYYENAPAFWWLKGGVYRFDFLDRKMGFFAQDTCAGHFHQGFAYLVSSTSPLASDFYRFLSSLRSIVDTLEDADPETHGHNEKWHGPVDQLWWHEVCDTSLIEDEEGCSYYDEGAYEKFRHYVTSMNGATLMDLLMRFQGYVGLHLMRLWKESVEGRDLRALAQMLPGVTVTDDDRIKWGLWVLKPGEYFPKQLQDLRHEPFVPFAKAVSDVDNLPR